MRALMLSLTMTLFCLPMAQNATAQNGPGYQWERPQGAAGATLRLSGPRGIKQFSFAAGQAVSINASSLTGDGVYRWELVFAPAVSASLLAQAEQLREAGDNSLPAGWPPALPTQNGILLVQAGQFALLDLEEVDPDQPPVDPGDSGEVPFDQVIADDLIVQGSECVGMDCVNNENFGADTIRLKENNLRINFEDTSNSASFPTNDWRIVANDADNGGDSYLAFEDSTAGRMPFKVEAGAPANSVLVENTGFVGFGTADPTALLHAVDGNTPTLRLDQNASDGFSPQIWDVAGNEANFFVRDVTNSSRLPFRIDPGAPTSSIHVEATGNVGVGIANSTAALHIRRANGFTEGLILADAADDGDPLTEERRLSLDNSGNLFVGGTITQLSSRHSKENLVTVAGSALLAQLRDLNLFTWNYRISDANDRHMGPVAEDFYRAFGLGKDERSVAPADMAGVALAASQALTIEIEQRDKHISELEARIAKLEAALEHIASAKN
ncbi:tail fiber domain-containing protein [Dokdonella sp.]|uniref:tail fiber domain-containing protein n=1 Tax=Dokdonella sp. TaxID=2291710 RepID=UPI0035286BEB